MDDFLGDYFWRFFGQFLGEFLGKVLDTFQTCFNSARFRIKVVSNFHLPLRSIYIIRKGVLGLTYVLYKCPLSQFEKRINFTSPLAPDSCEYYQNTLTSNF